MDEALVRELVELQKEQNALLKRYLWRLKFSLLSLLTLTTATAVCLGVMTYQNRKKVGPTPGTALTITSPNWSTTSSGTITLRANPQPMATPQLNLAPDDPFK